ncbi:hypothetical protein ACUUL3_03375 [Thiovibrio sp. JS02]
MSGLEEAKKKIPERVLAEPSQKQAAVMKAFDSQVVQGGGGKSTPDALLFRNFAAANIPSGLSYWKTCLPALTRSAMARPIDPGADNDNNINHCKLLCGWFSWCVLNDAQCHGEPDRAEIVAGNNAALLAVRLSRLGFFIFCFVFILCKL